MPLEDFRNIDPDVFEWVNPDEIQPGNVTCGFLKAPLGEAEGVVYPMVKVYTCVRFADNQPAPKGNVAGHCGGPGSLTTCVYFAAMYMGEDNPENYNIISFDQRGMGRSEPTFVVEECLLKTYDPMNNAALAVGKLLLCRLVDCIELDCKSISSLIYSSTQITTTRIPFAILPKFTKRGTLGVGSILDFR